MRSTFAQFAWPPLLAAGALAWSPGAQAQLFSADYALARPQSQPMAGLSLAAGRHWFARVGFEPDLRQASSPSTHPGPAEAVSIGGGYRWNNGQSLSLQVNRPRSPDRLGLSVSYDWPRYFVRLSYDSAVTPLPQDSLRFSAGVRF
jgi:hypothetical protein